MTVFVVEAIAREMISFRQQHGHRDKGFMAGRISKKQTVPTMELQKELNRQIREKDFRRVYMICGDQDYLRTQNKEKLSNAALGGGDEMNRSYYTGADFSVPEVIDFAQTLPFFADRRVVVLEDTFLFKNKGGGSPAQEDEGAGKKDQRADDGSGQNPAGTVPGAAAGETGMPSKEKAEAAAPPVSGTSSADSGNAVSQMSAFIREIPATTVMIFVEKKPDKRSALYKAIRANGFIMECGDLEEADMNRWIVQKCRDYGMAIDGQAVQRLLEYTGKDMLLISREIEKLAGYCAKQRRITQQDVSEIVSRTIHDRIFEMMDAIMAHSRDRALGCYMDLLKLQTAPQQIIAVMISEYNLVLQVGELHARGDTVDEIAGKVGRRDWAVKKVMRMISRYNSEILIRALQDWVQVSMDYKSGRIDPQLAVEELIVRYSA